MTEKPPGEEHPKDQDEPGSEEPAAPANEQERTEPEREPTPEPEQEPTPEQAPEQPAAPEPAAPEQPAAPEPAAAQKVELPPGAELDPIAITEERELSAEERARLEAEAEERARLEAEATEERPQEPVAAPAKPADLAKDARYAATGKRKSSVARVIVRPGDGSIEVNRRKLDEYFPRAFLQTVAKQALVSTGYDGTVNVQVRVHGGGIAGQASAVRHGIARALCEIDPNLRGELKKRGLLTRDARTKERRKAGLKKARKKPQFSKR
jgi:small subunit ribosomal protein S9